jgi:hypothetical protein
MRKGFRPSSLSRVSRLLSLILLIYLTRCYAQDPPPRHIIHPIRKSTSSVDPNNYRIIMVGHTFSKLYATVLHQWLFEELERRHLRARGKVGFRPDYQMIDHIFTLRAIIEEARHRSLKVNTFFVDF